MARLLFRRPTPGNRRVRGKVATPIQPPLSAVAPPFPVVDGFYGSDTKTAIQASQTAQELPATGQVNDVTYQRLTGQAPIPPLFHRCLQITSDYEGTGF